MQVSQRRRFLKTSTASIAIGCLATHPSLLADDPRSDLIDAHSHIWTPDTNRYPLAEGKTKADLNPASFTADELLATARPHGVKRVVLIQHQVYHGWDNGYLTDTAQKQPDVFRVVGMVDDTQPHPDQAMKRLRDRHVTGFRITPSIRGADRWLSGTGMESMWRCAAETRQAMCCLINPQQIPAVDRMCERFPDTPVVIDHFGRVGIDGQIRESDLRALCRIARHEHSYVKVSAFYALGQKRPPYDDLIPMIRRLYEAFGPQRLMWASDAPYQLQDNHSYAASISLVRDRLDFLSSTERQWLLRGTAEKVFFSEGA
jgi:predicted TIM-barrel fold metal-dependent hydrolase